MDSSEHKDDSIAKRGLDATVTSQAASVTPSSRCPRHDSKPANFPIEASVGIRNWMSLILNDMLFSKSGELRFMGSSENGGWQ
jgi:hypothetical protein